MFPPIEPYETGRLTVSKTHQLYWEQSGSPDGLPLVILHGGPGGASGPTIRQLYDPSFFRIIYFHQRGAGLSTPLGEIEDNTTWHLVEDIERLRVHLNVERWAVAGGSWGTTLALAYGQRHPHSCLAFLLNGIFLGRRSDIQWFLHAARDFFPNAWNAFVDFLPLPERDDILRSYRARIMNPDPAVAMPAVHAWSAYEGAIAALQPLPELQAVFDDPAFALPYARMNVHYFSNGCFLDDAPLLSGMTRLESIPALLIHGRYDLATPYRSAFELATVWPSAELITVPDGGHNRLDPPVGAAILFASERLKQILKR